MIWVWIAYLWQRLVWLTVPPKVLLPKIDVNAPCPGCGHTLGEIQCVQQSAPGTANNLQIQHKCKVCHAIFYEAPVMNSNEQRPRVVGRILNPDA